MGVLKLNQRAVYLHYFPHAFLSRPTARIANDHGHRIIFPDLKHRPFVQSIDLPGRDQVGTSATIVHGNPR